jgi:hypothetical protein
LAVSRRARHWRVLGPESCKSHWQPLRTPRWIFTLMKSDFRICLRQQNRHHRRVDPLRNRRLVRIESHHSKPFLPEKSRYFERFRKYEKNGRATLKTRLSLRPMAQTTVACHFRVSIGASLEFSASLIIEKFHSDRTLVLLPSGRFGRPAEASHLKARTGLF